MSTLRTLGFGDALERHDAGAAFVDLRTIDSYLEVHVPMSVELLYEFGPGMAARARDCIPLDIPLILLDLSTGDVAHAAASLRGKGFVVLGLVEDGVNQWAALRGAPASTETVSSDAAPEGLLLHVGDPGSRRPDGALHIPVEHLWGRAGELAGRDHVVICAGYGVRAALAVGILERAGVESITFWRTTSSPRAPHPPPWL
jgi:rhodanese-related sulfurtransferase